MAGFSLSEFKKIADACIPARDATELDESRLDSDLTELGYDSLTVYEIATRIQDELAIRIPDEQLEVLKTPRAFIEYVNEWLPGTPAYQHGC